MALGEYDHDIARRYLLGQLPDAEQQKIEERLLTEDDLFEELELTKDELTQEFVSGQLTSKEREWLQENLLRSPEGKQGHQFATAFNDYASSHRTERPKSLSWTERLSAFWKPSFLRPATAVAVLLIAVTIFWLARTRSPQSVATLTLINSLATRSTDSEAVQRVSLREDALKLNFVLPESAPQGIRYRVILIGEKGEPKSFEVPGQDPKSVSVEIPAAQLPRGQYAVTLSSTDAKGTVERIPGNYYFLVE